MKLQNYIHFGNSMDHNIVLVTWNPKNDANTF